MKYLKKIIITIPQINLILNNNIKFDDILIRDLSLSILKSENNSYSIKYGNKNLIIENFDFEDIVLKINDPNLYFIYFKNVLKKPYEDCKGIISDELINSALSSIESLEYLALQYSGLTEKRWGPKTEKTFSNKLEEALSDLKDELSYDDIGSSYEIGNLNVYDYIRYFKKRFPEFEKLLLDYSNRNGGLKITGIPYVDGNHFLLYRTILDEAIYNYTITNRGGTWPEIGINNKNDLLKLRNQIIDHGTLQFQLRGYGELDY
jgi:hypothetical protein